MERDGHLWAFAGNGGTRRELRALGDKLRVGKDVYERVEVTEPKPVPEKWAGLIGEYGWDHNTLYILERDGKLCALIEWFFLYPLTEVSADVYKFPDFGLYHDEKLVFTRDPSGRATRVVAAGVAFERRHIDGEDGKTFRINAPVPMVKVTASIGPFAGMDVAVTESTTHLNEPD